MKIFFYWKCTLPCELGRASDEPWKPMRSLLIVATTVSCSFHMVLQPYLKISTRLPSEFIQKTMKIFESGRLLEFGRSHYMHGDFSWDYRHFPTIHVPVVARLPPHYLNVSLLPLSHAWTQGLLKEHATLLSLVVFNSFPLIKRASVLCKLITCLV